MIQLQGDQRKKIAQFLIDEEIARKDTIKIHGEQKLRNSIRKKILIFQIGF